MTSVAVLLVTSAMGVHWGWQPVAGGGYEYIIRIEPHLIDSLKEGHPIYSDLPPELRDVRAYRIIVDDQPVPHEDQTPPVAAKSSRPELPPDAPAQAAQAPALFSPPQIEPPPAAATTGNPTSDPMVKQASGATATLSQYPEKTEAPSKSDNETKLAALKNAEESSKPWGVLTAVALGLFASIGLNVFLGWVNRDLRTRYRGLLSEMRPKQTAPA
jgi:hypothetical protein